MSGSTLLTKLCTTCQMCCFMKPVKKVIIFSCITSSMLHFVILIYHTYLCVDISNKLVTLISKLPPVWTLNLKTRRHHIRYQTIKIDWSKNNSFVSFVDDGGSQSGGRAPLGGRARRRRSYQGKQIFISTFFFLFVRQQY